MAYEEILKDYELRVETPIRLYQQAEKRVTALQEQLEGLGKTVAGRQARIEQICADNTYSELADLEACLVSRKRRLASLERRANAVRLLTDIVSEYQKEQASVLAGPVAEIVNRWLSILTEGSLERVELDENLIPRSTKSRHYEEALPMESLSFGTYEQIVVLLRLAIGVLVSKEEPNLVVVDDRLVNADNDRMNRLGLVLEEAAKSCQIILATCRDTPYAGISTTIIRVPQDGKASS